MNRVSNRQKIGIIGVGVVGGALASYFDEEKGISPFLYDTGKNLGSPEIVNNTGTVFLCVPTPFRSNAEGFNMSYILEACELLEGEKIVVIKSTVLPGTTEKLQRKYPQHKFLFNPEFLSERTADKDMRFPDRQIVGYTSRSKEIAEMVMTLLPDAPVKKIMPVAEAEMVKYFNNTFNAMKVIFANQMYDLCEKLGIDYDNVAEIAAASQFIKTISHLDVWHGGYRGYGGKCLVKDTRALIQFADQLGVSLDLHKTAEEINNKLMSQQGIEDPEILSKRE